MRPLTGAVVIPLVAMTAFAGVIASAWRKQLPYFASEHDPLVAVVEAPPRLGPVDLRAVPVGVDERGRAVCLPVLGSHTLVAGSTGAGKSGLLWSVICGLAPAVREGTVKIWAVDPKGGAELGAGADVFDRWCWDGGVAAAELLEDAVAGMRRRLARMREEGVRQHEPTVERPLIVVVIDELAALSAYVSDAALRRRISDALSLLLSQGRAAAMTVVAATQDPRKEVLGFRDLFPRRVALRTAEPVGDLILGPGARERGAETERIDPRLPGVGFVARDGWPVPVRFRAFRWSDARIAAAIHG